MPRNAAVALVIAPAPLDAYGARLWFDHPNAPEKDLVTKLASDVNGVKIMTNRMTVAGS
ncbi:MAG: hypothetical protein H6Q82_347 [Deltaproteobacteria bacterium]|nr:hypothetical protein [Deltaproteobacteria bacterium]